MTMKKWGGIASLVSGIVFLVPLLFYFLLLPAAGSSATHAKDPASFLPWMVADGNLRIALWWIVAFAFLMMMFGVPSALRREIDQSSPVGARMSELAGVFGTFILVVSSLMLAAGEMPIGQAFVNAGQASQDAIVTLYEWQRLVTALLFDVLGFGLLGVWIGVASVSGLRSKTLSPWFAVFGILASFLLFCFAVGYALDVSWLGESGIGAASFLALPVWLIWFGVRCVR